MTFFAQLSPGERLGELLFGLIMTLTFTIGAGVVIGTNEGASTELLYATIGCNVAWGIIDGALLVLGRLFDRGRLSRIGHAIEWVADEQKALAIVAAELDETLAPITTEADRQALYRAVVARVRSSPRRPPRLTAGDFAAAAAVFVLVFLASVPAAFPYLVIADPWLALRASNLLLIVVLFAVGYRWARYTNFNPLAAALLLTGLGVALVALAIPLGG